MKDQHIKLAFRLVASAVFIAAVWVENGDMKVPLFFFALFLQNTSNYN